MKQPLQATLVILTKNEEQHIERAVRSGHRFAEVIVVDSHSTDRTARIATDSGATVVEFAWDGGYPKKKEWALQHASFDWVIYLDADEYLSEALVEEIKSTITDDDISAFEVPLAYHWMGRRLRHGHRVTKRIGMRKSKGRWPRPDDLDVKNMWEVEGHYQPVVDSGNVVPLSATLGHDDRDGLYDYFARHNRYSDWEAAMLSKGDLESARSRSRLGRIALKLPFKPLVFFCYSYLLRAGFLDGRSGFDYAAALAFYYWQIELKRRELQSSMTNSKSLS
jgi:glycosyltransferase involved in cell wall biosynthesis